jgi:twitching motility protein PilJ
MNIFQKARERFFNIKIAYKFLSVLVAFIIGLTVISYMFQSALRMGEQSLVQVTEQSQTDKEIITHLRQDLKQYQKISSDMNVTPENKLIQLNEIVENIEPELAKLNNKAQVINQIQITFAKSHKMLTQTFIAVIVFVSVFIVFILWLVVTHGIIQPISKLQTVINEIATGNLEARVNSYYDDEIGHLAQAFDSLLDERVSALAKTEDDHLQLNNSIITLLRAVSVLSKKDLTIKVPVAEDMTGAVSDSINLLTSEIAATLREVTQISARVNSVSDQVKQQSGNVILFADNQRKEIDATLEELNTAVNTMVKIAQFSQVTNKESEKTMLTTESAVEAVAGTITSINAIRDIIRETEKRIKRLGERSQEITGVVNIINNIAERTHVLSLNAGMQAAAAGEAGKAFMVVANEVQRLAESSREATEKIATLVKNIQVDTSDTMKTMNTVISQVVDGTQQAEEAGKRMKESRATTQSLIAAVKKIAVTTIAQLEVGKSLKEHAHNIQTSTIKTNEQLQQQRDLSDALASDAEELIVKVSVFKLPE